MRIDRATPAVLGLIAALACALYLPFLSNPPFFDDGYVFSGYRFAEYASSPFGLTIRQPAYFSLAFVQVVWGGIAAHRITSLVFHVACAAALYWLIRELQRGTRVDRQEEDSTRARLAASFAASLFAVHPVAVYAAGYLVQRSIVLATLFSLLSMALFLRGLRARRYADAVSAAFMYSLAVLSKEHALLVAAAAVAGVWLQRSAEADERRFRLRYAACYLAACAPAAILVVLMAKGIVGQRYEPDFAEVAAQVVDVASMQEAPWLRSAVTQAALFFRYLASWLWPQTARMALDIRVDFSATWSPMVAVPAIAGLLAYGAFAVYLLSRRGRAAMAGFGLLLPWLVFLIEFSVVRFQEPFVLYRSYLWAPGFAITLAAGLDRLPLRAALVTFAAACLVLFLQAQDRLRSFSSGIALWEDAAGKLPSEPVPGGWRPLYNLGRAYLYAEQPQKAVAVVERCLRDYPGVYHCIFARAAIHMQLDEPEAALPYIARAIAARPQDGAPRHHLGVLLEQLGCREQARGQYELAYKLGFVGAKFRLQSLDEPGRGLLPPVRVSRASKGFKCPS